MGATDFCPPGSPKTWVGVYDHIFLEEAAKMIRQMDDTPTFHFVYTTSNHGPYKMPLSQLGFDADKVMPDIPETVRRDRAKRKKLGTYWYSDRAISRFIDEIRDIDPDSLIFVTGDHASQPIAPGDTISRQELTLRELFLTSFAMVHPGITQEILAGNIIGGHMNIMPTMLELIAPKGFRYFSYFSSLTEPIDHVVSPYHWLDHEAIGPSGQARISASYHCGEADGYVYGKGQKSPLRKEIEGFSTMTGWLVRHPELLKNINDL